MTEKKISKPFYLNPNVISVSRELLGKVLMTSINGKITGGFITETEAYAGPEDRASHAWNNRRTKRTEVMFREGGTAYVYLCYGIHHLFNIVTNHAGIPHAVLIRSIQPVTGFDTILQRRRAKKLTLKLCSGPGNVSMGLGIRTSHSGTDLTGNTIWVEDRGITIPEDKITVGPRVGVDYAGEDAGNPWRFQVQGSIPFEE